MKSKNLTVGELKANHLQQPVDAISVRDTCKQLLIALRLTDKPPCGTCKNIGYLMFFHQLQRFISVESNGKIVTNCE
jgi:hypothetical protein